VKKICDEGEGPNDSFGEFWVAKEVPRVQDLTALPNEIMPHPPCKYCFGSFEVRTKIRELYKHGVKLKLRPQAYQVLLLLLERSRDVVTREELQKRVWPSNTFVDFEHGLNTAIKELRGKLSDSASEPKYIETLPKLGYRLIVGVQAVAGVVEESVEESKLESSGPRNPAPQELAPAVAARLRVGNGRSRSLLVRWRLQFLWRS
jgi:DNA-binding winged helix-turn-helix (wHTH) protein